MIIILCIGMGVVLRLATGQTFGALADARFRGEGFLLGLLALQAVVPAFQFVGTNARIAYYVWLATFPGMIVVAWANRRLAPELRGDCCKRRDAGVRSRCGDRQAGVGGVWHPTYRLRACTGNCLDAPSLARRCHPASWSTGDENHP